MALESFSSPKASPDGAMQCFGATVMARNSIPFASAGVLHLRVFGHWDLSAGDRGQVWYFPAKY